MCELDVLQNIEDCKLCGCFGGSFRVYTSDIVGDYILMGKSDTLKHLNNIKESGEKYKKI